VNLACKFTITLLFPFLFASNSFCENGKSDNWFAKDKLQHFAVSTFYSGGIAVAANRHFDLNESKSLKLGIGITISLGAGKEVYDSYKPKETSSIKDFIWDLAGVALGAVIAGSII